MLNNSQPIWESIPPRQIFLVFALLMAGFFTIQSLYTPYQMGHDQTYVGIMIAKDGNPGLYKRDFVFHDDTFYGNYIPAFRFFLRQLIQLTGSYEKALLSLVPPLVFIYALGMGFLLYRFSQSIGITLALTFLAILYRAAPSGEIWGVGGVEFMLARTIMTAFVPLVFILFFKLIDAPDWQKGMLLGGLTGCMAFGHPVTALILGELFGALLLLQALQKKSYWPALIGMIVVYALMAWLPLTFFERQPATVIATTNFSEMRQVMHFFQKIPTYWGGWPKDPTETRVWLFLGTTLTLILYYILRPVSQRSQTMRHIWLVGGLVILYLCWRIAGKGAGLSWFILLAAIYVVWRYRQGDPEPLDWLFLQMGWIILLISLIAFYFITLLWMRIDSQFLSSLVSEHYRGVRLIIPFLFLFSAWVAGYLVPVAAHLLQESRQVVMWEYIFLAVGTLNRISFWLVASGVALYEMWRTKVHYRRVLVFGALGLMVIFLVSWASIPKFSFQVTHIWKTYGWQQKTIPDATPDMALYEWAKKETPVDALFFYNSPEFRFHGQRSITHALGDMINHRDSRYVEIYKRYYELEKAYSEKELLVNTARRLQVDYIVVEKNWPIRLYFPIVYENQKYLVYEVR
jgi:hypothetical protein